MCVSPSGRAADPHPPQLATKGDFTSVRTQPAASGPAPWGTHRPAAILSPGGPAGRGGAQPCFPLPASLPSTRGARGHPPSPRSSGARLPRTAEFCPSPIAPAAQRARAAPRLTAHAPLNNPPPSKMAAGPAP